jgi:hypothetical protein
MLQWDAGIVVESAAPATSSGKCRRPRRESRWEDPFAGERRWQRFRGGGDARATPDLAFRSLDQRRAIGRQARLRMQQPDPGSVPVALAPSGFLVVNPASRPR